MRLLLGAPSAILRFHTFLLRLLHRLPFFRSHRRFLLDLFIRFAFLGHAVRPVSVPLRPIVQRNDEWPLRVDSRPIKLDLATPRRMSANGQKRTFPFSSEAASYFSLTRAHKTLGSRCRTSLERLSRCLRSARQRRKPLKSCCRTMIARVTSKPLLLRIMQSPFPRHPVSPQGFGAVWTRA